MQQGLSATPATVFQEQRVLHFVFTMSPAIYLVICEVMQFTIDDFAGKGFQELDNSVAWALRGALLVFAIVATTITRTALSDDAMVQRAIKQATRVDDMTVVAAMQTGLILRFAITEAIAIFGLVLYMQTGNRVDYAFIVFGLIGVLVMRPSREHWNATFGRLALEHPGVTSMPL